MKTKEQIAVKQFKKSEMKGMERKDKIVLDMYVCKEHKKCTTSAIELDRGKYCQIAGCWNYATFIGVVTAEVL